MSATSPQFLDNLHLEHFDKSVNHESRLTLLSKCSKWRLSKNWGLVADGCNMHHRTSTESTTSRCAISGFVFSWPKSHNIHHRTSTESTPVDVRYSVLYFLARKSQDAHRTSRPIPSDSCVCRSSPFVAQSPHFMPPKRRCWKMEQRVGRVFSRFFARV